MTTLLRAVVLFMAAWDQAQKTSLRVRALRPLLPDQDPDLLVWAQVPSPEAILKYYDPQGAVDWRGLETALYGWALTAVLRRR